MQPGDTDGYGRHGILSIVHDDEGVRCHDCGSGLTRVPGTVRGTVPATAGG